MTVDEISEERGFAMSTVETHLFQCVQHGLLSAEDIWTKERWAELRAFVKKHSDVSLGEMYKLGDEKYSYSELRIAQYINKEND